MVATPAQRRSRKQEADGARKTGGSVQPASGSLATRKNDVRTSRNSPGVPLSIEYKTTGSAQYRLHLRDLRAAEKHAVIDSATMLFGVQFTGGPGVQFNYVVLAESDFLEMQQRVIELEKEIASYHRMGGFTEDNVKPPSFSD